MREYRIIIVARRKWDDAKVDNIINEKSLSTRLEAFIMDTLSPEIDYSMISLQVKKI
jgi:hypothetical protein